MLTANRHQLSSLPLPQRKCWQQQGLGQWLVVSGLGDAVKEELIFEFTAILERCHVNMIGLVLI